MKKIKEIMKRENKRIMTFKTTNGNVRVEKQLAHWFEDNEDMTEHFCFIYIMYNNETGEEMR